MPVIRDKKQFIDTKCTINIEGKEFESGGGFICKNKHTHKFEGIVYGNTKNNIVTNWYGDIKIPCTFRREYYSNFGDRRKAVYFRWNGKLMFGIWYSIDWRNIINVREVR